MCPIISIPSEASADIQVNTYTTEHQLLPKAAMAANGNFVIAWYGHGQEGDTSNIYAQLYDAAGSQVGSEFRVGTGTDYSQGRDPVTAMDANGNFVITWVSGGDGDGSGIYAQLYNHAGVPVGTVFQVNTYTTGSQIRPSTAMAANGNFVIAWESYGQDGDGAGIFAQHYDAVGTPLGSEFQVNTYTTFYQQIASTAMGANGNFVIAWEAFEPDGDWAGIYAQLYDATGNPVGSEFQANTYTDYPQESSTAMDANGNFVIAWESFWQDGDSGGIYAQRYDNAGNPLDSEFQVNTYTTHHQVLPSIAMDEDGDFVISWSSHEQDGDDFGVFAQRYDAVGSPMGTEFQVNSYTDSTQRESATAMDAYGNFVIAWESSGQDGDGYGIFMKLFLIDQDRDGVLDENDNCPDTYPDSEVSPEGCNGEQLIGFRCSESEFRNYGGYVNCVRKAAFECVELGLIDINDIGRIVSGVVRK
ncbi:MAG: hypothetical protein ABFS18_13075 [Thermodesulfobacteriota bacterium]